MRVLVVNAGSSSLKLRVLDGDDRLVLSVDLGAPSESGVLDRMGEVLDGAGDVEAVGHRVVHGGRRFRDSVVVDDGVEQALGALDDLAPLHNPPARATLRRARELCPDVPHVACFDTAFHAGLPDPAATYAVPWEWTERWGVRRYGFHGLNHAYAARRAAELVERPLGALRVVTCHLGAGASLAAVVGGRSVDTTMGFTPLEGLVMATRSGSVDPGALLWLQRHAGLDVDALEEALDHRSGLLGVSGLSADSRRLYAEADAGHGRARLALDVFLHRLAGMVAAMAAAARGVDVVVFTAGMGENSARLRAEAADRLSWLGVRVDPARNEQAGGDAVVSPPGHWPAACVVAAREDLEIAREVRRLAGPEPRAAGGTAGATGRPAR